MEDIIENRTLYWGTINSSPLVVKQWEKNHTIIRIQNPKPKNHTWLMAWKKNGEKRWYEVPMEGNDFIIGRAITKETGNYYLQLIELDETGEKVRISETIKVTVVVSVMTNEDAEEPVDKNLQFIYLEMIANAEKVMEDMARAEQDLDEFETESARLIDEFRTAGTGYVDQTKANADSAEASKNTAVSSARTAVESATSANTSANDAFDAKKVAVEAKESATASATRASASANTATQAMTDAKRYRDETITKANQFAGSINELTEKVNGFITDDEVSTEKTWSSQKIADEIEDISIPKFPNVTIFGQPTISNGQISNFSATNYCQFPFIVNFQGRPFELDFEITTGAEVTQQHNVFDSEFGLAFAVRNSRFVVAISTNGTSWNVGEGVGTHAVNPSATYRVKMVWDLANFVVSYSTDGGASYTEDIRIALTEQPYPKQMFIGITSDKSTFFNGIINLNVATLTISGKEVWDGMGDANLATRMAINMSNIDDAGESRVKSIARDAFGGAGITDTFYETIAEFEVTTVKGEGDAYAHAVVPNFNINVDLKHKVTINGVDGIYDAGIMKIPDYSAFTSNNYTYIGNANLSGLDTGYADFVEDADFLLLHDTTTELYTKVAGTYSVKVQIVRDTFTTFDKQLLYGINRLPIKLKHGSGSASSSFATVGNKVAPEKNSFAGGSVTTATGEKSTAFGYGALASGDASLSVGNFTEATGSMAVALGDRNKATNFYAFAEGHLTTASGGSSHAEGQNTIAEGAVSHAGGNVSKTTGRASFAHGNFVNATQPAQFAVGYGNAPQADSIFEVGNGLNASGQPNNTGSVEPATRQNAFRVTQDGTAIAQTALQIGNTKMTEAQLYEMINSGSFPIASEYMNSAGFHNSIFRGKDITSYYQDGSLWDRIAGTNGHVMFDDLWVGDYFKMSRPISAPNPSGGGITTGSDYVTIADFNGKDDNEINIPHIVLVPGIAFNTNQYMVKHFGTTRMNPTNTATGGYVNSECNKQVIGDVTTTGNIEAGATINEQLYAEFGSHLKTFRQVASNGINANGVNRSGTANGCANSWQYLQTQATLLDEVEVYGAPIVSSSYMDNATCNRQLSLYRLCKKAVFSGSRYYFKDVASAGAFCCEYNGANGSSASTTMYLKVLFVLG